MQTNTAVVIPHYQTRPGVLARTLAAVMAQEDAPEFEVIIVDDESPAPAIGELEGLDEAARARIRIVPRRNGGPAAAKNTGLAALPPEVEFVALLDCDDLWHPRHLARGMAAMERGYDLFFGDNRRENTEKSHFTMFGIDATGHVPLDGLPVLYQWNTELFDACVRMPVVGLSTTIFRRARFADLRFAEDVDFADDFWFALDVAHRRPRIAVSFFEEAVYGVADNISVVTDWRSDKAQRVTLSIVLCYVKLLKTGWLNPDNEAFVRRRLRDARRNFATTTLAILYRHHAIKWSYIRRFLVADPWVTVSFVAVIMRSIFLRSRA